jgi:hypothetical protein
MSAPDRHAPPIAFLATLRTMSVYHHTPRPGKSPLRDMRDLGVAAFCARGLASPCAASAGVGGLIPAGPPAWIPRLMLR